MYLDNDPGVLISACLFGDGAGAAVLSRQPKPAGRRMAWTDSTSLINPLERPALMFEQRDGMLRNVLSRGAKVHSESPFLVDSDTSRYCQPVAPYAQPTSQV